MPLDWGPEACGYVTSVMRYVTLGAVLVINLVFLRGDLVNLNRFEPISSTTTACSCLVVHVLPSRSAYM